jgi:hypothetical protein
MRIATATACLLVLFAAESWSGVFFSSATKLLDANKRPVGRVFDITETGLRVHRRLPDGRDLIFTIQSPATGLVGNPVIFHHEAPDCSDARHLQGDGDTFGVTALMGAVPPGQGFSNFGYYAVPPFADYEATAYETPSPGPPGCQPIVGTSYCCYTFAGAVSPQLVHAGAVGSIDMTQFHAPFSIK